jgi:hypothetical protein
VFEHVGILDERHQSGLKQGPAKTLCHFQGREILDGYVGYINPATGAITQIALPSGLGEPGPIITGPDGNLWFIDGTTDDIVRVTP